MTRDLLVSGVREMSGSLFRRSVTIFCFCCWCGVDLEDDRQNVKMKTINRISINTQNTWRSVIYDRMVRQCLKIISKWRRLVCKVNTPQWTSSIFCRPLFGQYKNAIWSIRVGHIRANKQGTYFWREWRDLSISS